MNPECRIPPYIEAFTGISNEMVADAPRFAEIAAAGAREAAQRTAAGVRGAQRALRLFVPAREFRRAELHFSANVLCTVKLSRRLFPEHPRHNLDAVMERHGLTCSARHRALGDARVLRDFWFKLRARTAGDGAGRGARKPCSARQSCRRICRADLADELPEGPGVYRFFGADDALLYVGRSNSLRTRVLAHFAGRAFRRQGAEAGARRCGASIGWRRPANSARCCAKPNGSRRNSRCYNRRLQGAVRQSSR